MAAIGMTQLQYAARGRSLATAGPGQQVPQHILAMTSTVRGSIRMVHTKGPAAGVAHVQTILAPRLAGAASANPGLRGTATAAQNYIACVQQYATWNATSDLAYCKWELHGVVTFSPSDRVDGLVRVVLADAAGAIYGRVVLWDTEPLSRSTSEVIAAVAVEVLDHAYCARTVRAVDVWQLRDGDRYRVPAAVARAARPTAAALVASM